MCVPLLICEISLLVCKNLLDDMTCAESSVSIACLSPQS
jgi:hypothetical protein